MVDGIEEQDVQLWNQIRRCYDYVRGGRWTAVMSSTNEFLAQASHAKEIMVDTAQRIHLPFSPRWRFAIFVGLGIFFTSLVFVSFRYGLEVGKGGMDCVESRQIGHGVAPLWRLPAPPWMDRGIYHLEDGCLPAKDDSRIHVLQFLTN